MKSGSISRQRLTPAFRDRCHSLRGVHGEFVCSSCGRRLVQPSTVTLPTMGTDIERRGVPVDSRFWQLSLHSRMRTMLVIELFELQKPRFQICRRPIQGAVQAFSPDGTNEPFDKRM